MGTEEQQRRCNRSVTCDELIKRHGSVPVRWQSVARLSCRLGRDMSNTSMTLEDVDALLEWKVHGYIAARNAVDEGMKMQDQITIELRVDFADKEKIPELIKIACAAARHMLANVQLLGPACQPECVVFTDNFMSPPVKISNYSDLVGTGRKELEALAGSGVSGAVTDPVTGEEGVSSELLAAMK